jgi:hypothetical protein
MTAWDVLRYLYFASCLSMGWYIINRADQFLISYGISKTEQERSKQTPGLSFTATMMLYVLLSPVLWLVILDQNNRRKK